MNYTELNDDPIEIPSFNEAGIFPYDPYQQGMYDYWFKEANGYRFFGRECELYLAGKRNAMLMIETLRNDF